MTGTILRVENLCKNFGALAVTRHVSLDVSRAEIHALIGPNGAGKSSLIAQIAGTLRPDAGRIFFNGRDVTHLGVAARAALGLGRVFQTSNLIGSFTAFENIALAAEASAGAPFTFQPFGRADYAVEAEVQRALDRAGLGARGSIAANALSHGEKRALELAMALVQKPRLVLLDEPMSGAGRSETNALTRLLLSLKGKVAMLLVEHDMSAVFTLASRVTVLAGGAIIASGAPDEIKRHPGVREAYLGDAAI
jgi:branched-chain amino acid transport system ATP-binding protein